MHRVSVCAAAPSKATLICVDCDPALALPKELLRLPRRHNALAVSTLAISAGPNKDYKYQ
jgi:hypothetical protein